MRRIIALLSCLAIAVLSLAHANNSIRNYVLVEETEAGSTSELLDMPIGASPNLSGAEISLKYFGPQSDSDVSIVLTLHGAKGRYTPDETLGARFFAGDTPLSKNKYRMISRVMKQDDVDIVNTHLTLEELAWLATASPVKIEIYNGDTHERYDTFVFTPTGLAQFKRFAKSVLVIKSEAN
jgi:hypothetical protein